MAQDTSLGSPEGEPGPRGGPRVGMSRPILPWLEAAAGSLGTPSPPPQLGAVFPEGRGAWVLASQNKQPTVGCGHRAATGQGGGG